MLTYNLRPYFAPKIFYFGCFRLRQIRVSYGKKVAKKSKTLENDVYKYYNISIQ